MLKDARGVIEFVVHLEGVWVVGKPRGILDVEDIVAELLPDSDGRLTLQFADKNRKESMSVRMLREIRDQKSITQKGLSQHLGLTAGRISQLIKAARNTGYLVAKGPALALTASGLA